MNWIPAARLSSTARWVAAVRRRSSSCGRLGLRKCTTWRAGLPLGRREWIRGCRSTEGGQWPVISGQLPVLRGARKRSLFHLGTGLHGFGLNIVLAGWIMAFPWVFPQHSEDSCGRRVADESFFVSRIHFAVLVVIRPDRGVSGPRCLNRATTGAARSPGAARTDGLHVKEGGRARRRNARNAATESNHIFGRCSPGRHC